MQIQRVVTVLVCCSALLACENSATVDRHTPDPVQFDNYGASLTLSGRVHMMPVQADSHAAFAKTAAPAGAQLQYFGGHVLSNVKVVPVLWGSAVAPTVANGIAQYFKGVTNSAYFDWLKEYNTNITAQGGQPGTNQTIGRGTAVNAITITPGTAGTSLTDAQIQTEISNQIGAGKLPAPDANTLYMTYFPPGISITSGGGSSCVAGGFCAYHGTFNRNTTEIFYGVMPDMSPGSGCASGCGTSPTQFQNETSVSAHEMIEATTDAEVGLATVAGPPLAWYDNTNGEIGDICNGQQGTVVGGDGVTYTVQTEWSNKAGACIVTAGTTTCNGCVDAAGTCQSGTSTSACGTGGAACTACASGQTCTNGTCQTATCNGCLDANGTCQSGTSTSACGAGGNACVACASGQSCTNGTCQTATCNGCVDANGTCQSGTSTSACGAGGNACVACASGQSCTNGTCQTATCNGCVDSSGTCQSGTSTSACGAGGNVCVACASGQTCTNGTCQTAVCNGCVSANGTCQSGTSNSACGAGGNACVACASGQSCVNGTCQGTGTCSHPDCSTGGPLKAGCDACSAQICSQDPYCCAQLWDSICVSEVATICGKTCGGGSCSHPICQTGKKLKGSCDPCASQICAADPYCCKNKWDSVCVSEVTSICGSSCP